MQLHIVVVDNEIMIPSVSSMDSYNFPSLVLVGRGRDCTMVVPSRIASGFPMSAAIEGLRL